jgi:hypothetical protein
VQNLLTIVIVSMIFIIHLTTIANSNMTKRIVLHLLVAIFCCVSLPALSQDGLDLATPTNAVDELDGEEAAKISGPSSDSKNSQAVGNNATLTIGDDGKVGKSSALPVESLAPPKVAPAATPAIPATVSAVETLDDEILVGDFSSLPAANDFSGAPAVPGTMRLLADEEAPEDYVIEDGDTLIDICDQLLDEAGYWPKLWALNPEIKNPHFIFPLMRLRFYPGDDENPPYLQVVAEEDTVPIDKADLEETQLVAERVDRVEKSDKPETIVVGTGETHWPHRDLPASRGQHHLSGVRAGVGVRLLPRAS